MFDSLADVAVLEAMGSPSRAENAACARRLAAIGELYALRAPDDDGERINLDGISEMFALGVGLGLM